MSRVARKYSESSYYHVMAQGISKEKIFSKDLYAIKYLYIIREKIKNSGVTILSYCIMDNHVHLLVFCKKPEYLSLFMKKVNISYSSFYNLHNNRCGYVFRDRFKTQSILNRSHLFNCIKYIHNNPVKAHMVKNISDYKYSSYREYIGKLDIITNDSIKLLFGNDKEYKKYFYNIHNDKSSDFNFIDVKQSFKEYFKNIENIPDIKNNNELLIKFIKKSREETDITLNELAKVLKMSKSTVARLANKI